MNTGFPYNDDDELKDTPILRSLRSNKGFDAPEGYFDELTSDIQDRINQPERGIRFSWKPVVASLTIGGLAIYLFFAVFNKSETIAPNASQVAEIEISSEDLITSEYYMEMDEELIATSLTERSSDETNKTNISSGIEDYLLESSNEDELINAL